MYVALFEQGFIIVFRMVCKLGMEMRPPDLCPTFDRPGLRPRETSLKLEASILPDFTARHFSFIVCRANQPGISLDRRSNFAPSFAFLAYSIGGPDSPARRPSRP